jgi:hypothetical protein
MVDLARHRDPVQDVQRGRSPERVLIDGPAGPTALIIFVK